MAVIDYYGIETEIQAILKADSNLAGIHIEDPEKLPSFDPSDRDGVYIYLEDEGMPDEIQRIRAGQTHDSILRFSIWVFAYHDDVSLASQARDDLRGNVALALTGNRTINGKVKTSWLRGGRFNRLEDNGFWSGAELILEAHAQMVV